MSQLLHHRLLQHGMTGPDVEDLQSRLNRKTPTRLPRLKPDKTYGTLTMARVMEFQFQHHLGVDGSAGPNTFRVLSGGVDSPHPTAPRGRCILVDLINRRLMAFEDGAERVRVSPIMGGGPDTPSTRGVFPMTPRRYRQHTSNQFPAPPGQRNMDFAMYYHKGEAIHQGSPYAPSHACIHVPSSHAERLFDWVGNTDVLVIVVRL